MAELVDAHPSQECAGNGVRVELAQRAWRRSLRFASNPASGTPSYNAFDSAHPLA
jgi:hypothetical protein